MVARFGSQRVVATLRRCDVAPAAGVVSVVAAGSPVGTEITVPEGRNSHTDNPTPGAAAALETADVVFLNGLQLE